MALVAYEGAEIPSQPKTAMPAPHREGWTKAHVSDNPEDRPEKWRKRAEELRAIAAEFAYAQARDDLLQLAAQWDEMARREEARLGIKRPLRF
jgi:hypothetical protein